MKKFRERTFVFGCRCWSCVFWWVFAYVFAFCFGGLLPKVFGKILLMSGLLFLKKFSGANFCFLGVGVGHVFVGAILLMFLLYVLAVRSRSCLDKFS